MKSYRLAFLVLSAQVILIFSPAVQAALVAQYKLDDAVGSATAADSSGNGYNATVSGTSGFTGSSFYFNQTGVEQNYIVTPQNIPALTNKSFSWSAWVRADSNDQDKSGSIVHRGVDTTWMNGHKCFAATPSGMYLAEYGQQETSSTSYLWDNQWHNAIVTYDQSGAGTIRIYVDGKCTGVKGMSLNNEPESTAWQFFFGAGAGEYFKGEMKDIRIYDHRLTLAEIWDVAGLEGTQLVAYYKLNDAIGSGGITDSSGNKLNGGLWGTSNFTGSSFYFNQTGDAQNYLFSASNMPAMTNESFSWALWVRCDTTDPGMNGTLIQRSAGDLGWADGYKALSANSSSTTFGEYGQENTTSPVVLWDNNWHHVAVTFDDGGAGTVHIYTDGVMTGIKGMNLMTEPDSMSWPLVFGAGAGGWFRGEMKEIRIYKGVLSDVQVAALAGVFAGDLDNDKDVDFADLKDFAELWLEDYTATPGTDTAVENGDYENYDATTFAAHWQDNTFGAGEGTSVLSLLTNSVDSHAGSKAMRWEYNNTAVDPNNTWAEIVYAFDTSIDLSNYDYIKLWVKRHAGNSQEGLLYLKILDYGLDQGSIAAESGITQSKGSTYADADLWYEWVIDLDDMTYNTSNGYYDKTSVTVMRGIQLGVSDTMSDKTGGTGTIDIDDISLGTYPICGSSTTGDFDGNCVVDLMDFAKLAETWMLSGSNPGI